VKTRNVSSAKRTDGGGLGEPGGSPSGDQGLQGRRYRIGEVAERVGVTTRTIRYYEELGLLGSTASRTKGAHRLYTEADIARLEELLRLRDLLGLTLEELQTLAEAEEALAALRDQWAETASDPERARIVKEAIPVIERQLELVRRRQQKLAEFADDLSAKLRSLHLRQAELGQKRREARSR
jgi:MerR family transcriptional regulator, repressor of the yfmOP operon